MGFDQRSDAVRQIITLSPKNDFFCRGNIGITFASWPDGRRNDISMSKQLIIVAVIALSVSASFSQAAKEHESDKKAFLPPVAPACVSSPFGPRILPNRPLAGTFHTGIDLPAPLGAPVAAVAPGTIIRIQHRGVGGLEMLIQHNGFVGVYSHLGLITPVVAEGRKVVYGGEKIAVVGHTGVTYGPHLYFGMLVNGQPIDPAPYLDVRACGLPQSTDTRIHPTRLFAGH